MVIVIYQSERRQRRTNANKNRESCKSINEEEEKKYGKSMETKGMVEDQNWGKRTIRSAKRTCLSSSNNSYSILGLSYDPDYPRRSFKPLI